VLGEMSFDKLGREVEKAQKKAKSGKLQIDQEELTKQLKAIQTTGVKPKTKLHKKMVKSHSYSTKQVGYTPENYKPKVNVDETEPKQTMINADLLNDDEADIHKQKKAKKAV